MKTMTSVSAALLLGCVLAAPSAIAARRNPPPAPAPAKASAPAKAAKTGIGKGDMEFGLGVVYDNYEDTDTNQLTINASIGKFLSDTSEFTISPTISWTDSAGSSSFTFAPLLAYQFLFRGPSRNNPVVPYVGAGIGINLTYLSGAVGGSSTLIGVNVAPVAGVKAFVSERMSVEYALSYQVGLVELCNDVDCYNGDSNILQNAVRFNIYY